MHTTVLSKQTQSALDSLVQHNFITDFYLAGGTAAALQLGHRRSIDLDFFTQKTFNSEQLLQKLSILSPFNIIEKDTQTLTGHWMRTRLEFFHYPYPRIDDNVIWNTVTLAGLKDIALMKISAIAGRGSKKDFFDLYEICTTTMSLSELLPLMSKKFTRVIYDHYHILKSLVFFDDAEPEPDPDMLKKRSWNDVKQYFKEQIREIDLSF